MNGLRIREKFMEIEFPDEKLDRLEIDPGFTAGFGHQVVEKYRRRIQLIRAATDERAFYQMGSLHYEKLKGKRSHQKSMRLHEQWRLILEIGSRAKQQFAVVVSIEDYH